MSDEIMTISKAAARCGVAVGTIDNEARRGHLAVAERHGTRRLFAAHDLDAWSEWWRGGKRGLPPGQVVARRAQDRALETLNDGDRLTREQAAAVYAALGVRLPVQILEACTDPRREVRAQLAWEADIWRRMADDGIEREGWTPEQCLHVVDGLEALRARIRPGWTE